ncbi:hypothetical protein KSP40_PGU015996 [Platanthera guangdongensis]|uniref:Cytochrome c-type biogenesis protein CcmF C-terminal domain-containing protein n=1 Tax=Platanthera guangdongensis TaxID=2320717 RepID=A0ABR2MYJ4_9ASPA
MRQKLIPRMVRRSSLTPARMVRLRSTNKNKIQFTQRLPLGPELHMGKERCCLRGLDHLHGPTFHGICGNFLLSKPSPTSDRFMFEHDESLRADLLPRKLPASYESGKLEHFLHRWMKNNEHKNLWFTMFPEKRYFFSIRETTSTTEVAIHTNLFTDLYAPIGTGSSRTGGWYTTIMKLPFLFSIRIGFLLASSGGSRSLLCLYNPVAGRVGPSPNISLGAWYERRFGAVPFEDVRVLMRACGDFICIGLKSYINIYISLIFIIYIYIYYIIYIYILDERWERGILGG